VPDPRYYNANKAAFPSGQHNAINVLNVATAPAAFGTSIASQATPLQATNVVPIARIVTASLAALAACTASTDGVRQLILAKLLAVTALAAVGHDSVSYKEAMAAANAEKWAAAC
jgi:hypothetical protein